MVETLVVAYARRQTRLRPGVCDRRPGRASPGAGYWSCKAARGNRRSHAPSAAVLAAELGCAGHEMRRRHDEAFGHVIASPSPIEEASGGRILRSPSSASRGTGTAWAGGSGCPWRQGCPAAPLFQARRRVTGALLAGAGNGPGCDSRRRLLGAGKNSRFRLAAGMPMSHFDIRSAVRPDPDREMVDIADYVVDYVIDARRLTTPPATCCWTPSAAPCWRCSSRSAPSSSGPSCRARSCRRRAGSRHRLRTRPGQGGVRHRHADPLARLQRHLAGRRVGPPLRQPGRDPGRRPITSAARPSADGGKRRSPWATS